MSTLKRKGPLSAFAEVDEFVIAESDMGEERFLDTVRESVAKRLDSQLGEPCANCEFRALSFAKERLPTRDSVRVVGISRCLFHSSMCALEQISMTPILGSPTLMPDSNVVNTAERMWGDIQLSKLWRPISETPIPKAVAEEAPPKNNLFGSW